MNKIIKKPAYDLPHRIECLRGHTQVDVYDIVRTMVDCPLSLSEFNKILHGRTGNGDSGYIGADKREGICRSGEEVHRYAGA